MSTYNPIDYYYCFAQTIIDHYVKGQSNLINRRGTNRETTYQRIKDESSLLTASMLPSPIRTRRTTFITERNFLVSVYRRIVYLRHFPFDHYIQPLL
jgi:hypothetical protein